MTIVSPTTTPVEDGSDRFLHVAAVLFAVAVLVHNTDHLRRGGDAVSTDVFALGTLGIALEVAVVALVLTDHRWGALAAAAIGASLAAGYVLVHLSPQRSWLSDSLRAGEDVTWFSWVAVLALVAASLLLAGAGWIVVRRRGGLASAAKLRSPGRGGIPSGHRRDGGRQCGHSGRLLRHPLRTLTTVARPLGRRPGVVVPDATPDSCLARYSAG